MPKIRGRHRVLIPTLHTPPERLFKALAAKKKKKIKTGEKENLKSKIKAGE